MVNNREIQLTLNKRYDFRSVDIELLRSACLALGFSSRSVYSVDMFHETIRPYAALNLSGPPNETHLRYLRRLEISGTHVLNPIYSSIVADDKALSNLEISGLGLKTAKSIDLQIGERDPRTAEHVRNSIGFPCVIKYPKSARGVGVHLIKDEAEFEDVYDLLFACNLTGVGFNSTINPIAQEYIANSHGKDLRVVILGDECLGGMSRRNPIGWNIKRSPRHPVSIGNPNNLTYEKIDVDPMIQRDCIEICRKLGLTFAGIDILYGKDGPVYGEVNSFPGLYTFDRIHPELNLPKRIIEHLTKRN